MRKVYSLHAEECFQTSFYTSLYCKFKSQFVLFVCNLSGSIGPDDPVTKLRKNHQGTLYCLHPDKSITKHLEKVSISNGMAWTLDNSTMYFIDSMTFGIDAFDYNLSTGSISKEMCACLPYHPILKIALNRSICSCQYILAFHIT